MNNMKLIALAAAAALFLCACQSAVTKTDMPPSPPAIDGIANLGSKENPVKIWRTLKNGDYEAAVAVQEPERTFADGFNGSLPRQAYHAYVKTKDSPYRLVTSLNSAEIPRVELLDVSLSEHSLSINTREEGHPREFGTSEVRTFTEIALDSLNLAAPDSEAAASRFEETKAARKGIDGEDLIPESLKKKKARVTKYANGTCSISFPPFSREYYRFKDAEYAFNFDSAQSLIETLGEGGRRALSTTYWDYPFEEFISLNKKDPRAREAQ